MRISLHMAVKLSRNVNYSKLKKMRKTSSNVQGLMATKDKENRSRILSIMEQNTEITLQKVTERCQKLINIKLDEASIEGKI